MDNNTTELAGAAHEELSSIDTGVQTLWLPCFTMSKHSGLKGSPKSDTTSFQRQRN